MSRPHLIPGPEHPITVTPASVRVVVRADGHVVADTTDALALQESTHETPYPAVSAIEKRVAFYTDRLELTVVEAQ